MHRSRRNTTYLAGLLGIVYVARGIATPWMSPEDGRTLYRMIYGTLCFSIFFSFVGTVLGGLWADDSWGRFWGWDPKENGALLIVLAQLAIIHARMGGLLRDFGVNMAAIVGGGVVAFSWWGVNLLGVGLHTYGWTGGVWTGLIIFYVIARGARSSRASWAGSCPAPPRPPPAACRARLRSGVTPFGASG